MASKDRAQLLHNLANLIEKHIDEFVALESLDNGKPIDHSRNDIAEVVVNLR